MCMCILTTKRPPMVVLARRPLLGPFLPEFVDTRKYKRRDVFTGLPLPDEAEAPLGRLLQELIQVAPPALATLPPSQSCR